jgi:menaquinone-dependent protoporphyrinogen oxidase
MSDGERISVGMDDKGLWSGSRRDLLRLCAGLVGAMVFEGTAGRRSGDAAEAGFPEIRCGDENPVGKKVLITYASKYGSTGGVAEAMGRELCHRGIPTDVLLVQHASHLDSYDGIVVGSAIYKGQWLSEAVHFIGDNRPVLSRVPVAYFLVCMTLSHPTDEKRSEALAYMDPLLKSVPEVRPFETGTFAGALYYSNLSWIYRMVVKSKGAPEGDFRDWNAIRAWARGPLRETFLR